MKHIILLLILLLQLTGNAQNPKNHSIGFKENKGQIVDQKGKPNGAVKFLLNSPGLNVQLKKNGFSYDVYETRKMPLGKKDRQRQEQMRQGEANKTDFPDYSLEYIYHRVDVGFEGSNSDVLLVAEEKSKDYDNYYTVEHAPEGILTVHQFQKVTYKNLYPKIDVVFFIPQDSTKTVEYNFVIHPGGKVSDIQMKFNGAKTDLVDNKIKMDLRFGIMEETLPLSWVEEGAEKREIPVGYTKIRKNIYGFAVAKNITTDKTIVIDPVPVRLWGTYYGGADAEFPRDIKISNQDGIYLWGGTYSTNNIATAGSYQTSYQGTFTNNFFVKFTTEGVRIWGTYGENFNYHQARAMAVDSDLNIYLGSRQITSTNVATLGAYQTVKNMYYDTYLVKYNDMGFLQWATYYGGNGNENLQAICTDALNNVYIVGDTSSTNVFSSPGAHQETNLSNPNYLDGFIAKFTPDGQRVWGTFFGGVTSESINSCSISEDNFLYVSGWQMAGSGNISTPGSYLEDIGSNAGGFIAKFTLDGTRLWTTYTGISDRPIESIIQGDYIYLHGLTENNSTSTPGTFLENLTFHEDSQLESTFQDDNSFIIKFNIQTQQKIWGTYFFERINKIAVNNNHELYFCGQTKIFDGISTPNAYKPVKEAFNENYIIKLNHLGQRIWGTYYTGAEGNMVIDSSDNLYLFGVTTSSVGITTGGAHQSEKGGGQDVYLVKFRDCLSSITASSNSPICNGNNIELTANGGTNYSWTGPNNFTSNLQNPVIPNADASHAGEYFCSITGGGDCDDTISVTVIIGDTIAPIPDLATLPVITGTCNALTIPIPTASDACTGNVLATTASPLTFTEAGSYTVVWNYSDGTNTVNQNQTVIINPQPLPVADANAFFCYELYLNLSDITITGQNIQWYDAQTNGNALPDNTLLDDGTTYYASQMIDGCESARIPVMVTIQHTFGPTGFAVQYFCDTQNLTLENFVVTGTDVVFYDSQFGGNILPMTTPLVDDMGYWASQTVNGCESSLRLPMISDIISDLPANDYAENICDDLNDDSENVDLSLYNDNIISNAAAYDFTYYTDYNNAENEIPGTEIIDFTDYGLFPGVNMIYVRVENTTLCYKIATLQLSLIASPLLNMEDEYSICEGIATTIHAAAGFDSYSWSTGSQTASEMFDQAGNYSITVTQNHGTLICATTKNFTVVASNRATITNIVTSDWTSNENTITILVTGSGDYEYSIDGINYQSSNQFYGLANGEYTVYVNDKNDCGLTKGDVYILMYPKFFTPNGDSYNDSWGIHFSESEPHLTIRIFDRFGKLIKMLSDIDPTWDGTYNGSALPATDYWFSVTRQNGQEHLGHFSLKR